MKPLNIIKLISFTLYLVIFTLPSISAANTNVMQYLPAYKNMPSNKQNVNLLYALSAESGSYQDKKLTLKGVKEVLFFSDEPKRIAGQITPVRFQSIWDKKFADTMLPKPNAVLSVVNTPENINITIELLTQSMEKDGLTYTVEILEGDIPASFGRSTIFIDNIDTPINGQITD